MTSADWANLVRFHGDSGVLQGMSVRFGKGDDTLVGGSVDGQSTGISALGDHGHDIVLNASYFDQLVFFETFIDDE